MMGNSAPNDPHLPRGKRCHSRSPTGARAPQQDGLLDASSIVGRRLVLLPLVAWLKGKRERHYESPFSIRYKPSQP